MRYLLMMLLTAAVSCIATAGVPGQYLVLRETVRTGQIALLSATPV